MNGKLSDQPVVVAQSAKQAVGVVGGAVSITLHLSRPPESFNAAYWLVNCAQTNCSAAATAATAAVAAAGATSIKTDDEAGRALSLPRPPPPPAVLAAKLRSDVSSSVTAMTYEATAGRLYTAMSASESCSADSFPKGHGYSWVNSSFPSYLWPNLPENVPAVQIVFDTNGTAASVTVYPMESTCSNIGVLVAGDAEHGQALVTLTNLTSCPWPDLPVPGKPPLGLSSRLIFQRPGRLLWGINGGEDLTLKLDSCSRVAPSIDVWDLAQQEKVDSIHADDLFMEGVPDGYPIAPSYINLRSLHATKDRLLATGHPSFMDSVKLEDSDSIVAARRLLGVPLHSNS